MTRAVFFSVVCLGLAAGTGCGGKSEDAGTSGGLTAEQMKQNGAGAAPQGGLSADQMKKGNPRR